MTFNNSWLSPFLHIFPVAFLKILQNSRTGSPFYNLSAIFRSLQDKDTLGPTAALQN